MFLVSLVAERAGSAAATGHPDWDGLADRLVDGKDVRHPGNRDVSGTGSQSG